MGFSMEKTDKNLLSFGKSSNNIQLYTKVKCTYSMLIQMFLKFTGFGLNAIGGSK